jgi:hypothetical protein
MKCQGCFIKENVSVKLEGKSILQSPWSSVSSVTEPGEVQTKFSNAVKLKWWQICGLEDCSEKLSWRQTTQQTLLNSPKYLLLLFLCSRVGVEILRMRFQHKSRRIWRQHLKWVGYSVISVPWGWGDLAAVNYIVTALHDFGINCRFLAF